MGGSGGPGAVLVCLLLLLDRLLLGFRMLIIEETGTQEVLQLCDVRGGWERRSTCGTGAGATTVSPGARPAGAARRDMAAHAPDLGIVRPGARDGWLRHAASAA